MGCCWYSLVLSLPREKQRNKEKRRCERERKAARMAHGEETAYSS